MTQWKRAGLASSTALASILFASTAFAQITPEEVWQTLQDTYTAGGMTVTSTSEARDGDVLVVEGLEVAIDQDGTTGTVAIDEMSFADNGDGSVTITMSESYPVDMTLPAAEGEDGPTELSLIVSQPDLAIVVSGAVGEAKYDFTAPSMVITLDEVSGVDADKLDVTATVSLSDVAGSYLIKGDVGAQEIDSTFGASSMAMDVSGSDPETQSDFAMTASVADLAATSKSRLAGMDMMANLADALKAGFATNTTLSYGAVSLNVDATEAGALTRVITSGMGGELKVVLAATGLLYGVSGKGAEITVSSPDIPFPEVKMSYAEGAFNVLMPMLKSEQPSNFTFVTRIVDLVVSEELWGMIDPTGAVPHDPATLILDTKGKVKLTTDLADQTQMDALGDAPPGEIYALDLTELNLSVAGAQLTGAGAFTFDNTDLATFGGMPAPTGKIDLKLVGGNVLLEKLVAMGLLTEDDANGARMMMSMFANPGAGADELTSTLEFKDKGFFANGQQLQ